MVTALNIANAILYKGFNEGIDLTPMKLQRLLYLTYKEFYKRTNTLLFDEKFEVWKYGPVVRSVNAAFKKYGSNCIKDYYREYNGTVLKASEDKNPTFKSILTYIWDKYKKLMEYHQLICHVVRNLLGFRHTLEKMLFCR